VQLYTPPAGNTTKNEGPGYSESIESKGSPGVCLEWGRHRGETEKGEGKRNTKKEERKKKLRAKTNRLVFPCPPFIHSNSQRNQFNPEN